MNFDFFRTPLATAALLVAVAAQAQPATYKIACIDPLSGPFANVGELMLAHTRAGAIAVVAGLPHDGKRNSFV